MAIEGLRLINQLHEKYDSDLHTKVILINLEKEIKNYLDIVGDYEELKSDWESLVGVKSMLDYYRERCKNLEKEIEDLRSKQK